MSVDAILKEVEALTDDERNELLNRLHDQFGQPEMSDELKAELDRRDAAYEANPDQVYTWEQVLEYVRRKKKGVTGQARVEVPEKGVSPLTRSQSLATSPRKAGARWGSLQFSSASPTIMPSEKTHHTHLAPALRGEVARLCERVRGLRLSTTNHK